MLDSAQRKTILILTLAIALVISLLVLIAQDELREILGPSFYIIGLSIIGCILLVLAGYIWDRNMVERLRGLRDSSQSGAPDDSREEEDDHDEVIGLARNIERMARSLQKVEASYRGIVEDQVDLICRYLPDGKLTFVNGSYAQSFGRKRQDLIGEAIPFFDAGHIASQVSQTREYKLKLPNDQIACIKWTQRPILDDRGNLLEYQAVGHDITKSKEAESALLQAKEAAEAADRAKGQFLAIVSHEIKTPLNGIMGFADTLSDSDLAEEQREQVKLIRTSGLALSKLINDILDLSKIEAGKVEISHEMFALHACVNDVCAFFTREARQAGLQLICSVAPDVPEIVRGDETRLRQILTNLLGNSIKFTERGKIEASLTCSPVSQPDDANPVVRLFFTITDTGVGIDDDKIGQLFQPFSQVDASLERRRSGTGLGLAISKRLCELMGGSISVESRKGEGSVFRFSLQMERE
ncbi:MAG: PAS domain S-box protein [Cephaloticoccus sp.]|nr:PAS domain S-box protein [Cephaloticoccus sp.]MCF7761661.1 PAS domain S-box protein [Cephaloticoccus sp.]